VERKGKMAALHLDNGKTLVIHLGMGGQMLLRDTDEHDPDDTALVYTFDDATALHVHKLQLGNIHVVDTGTLHEPDGRFGEVGLDALDGIRSPEQLREMLGSRRAAIKSMLTDQALLSGIGNTYADEILFKAGIHPATKAADLDDEDFRRLCVAIEGVLRGAVRSGGADHVGLHNRPEEACAALHVHQREGQACPVCQTGIEATKVGGRTTFFCRGCQPRK
jgi:formamidopyrimidine-DNA glycosylase